MERQAYFEQTHLPDPSFPFNIFKLRTNNPVIIHPHFQESVEIIFLLQGEVTSHIGTESIDASKGDILIVNSYEIHQLLNSRKDSKVACYAIVFNPSFVSSYSDSYTKEHILPFIGGELSLPRVIRKENKSYLVIRNFLSRAIREFKNSKTGNHIAVNAYLNLFIIEIIRAFGLKNLNDYLSSELRQLQRFVPVFKYVESHYMEAIKNSDAAKSANMTYHHFCKSFKKFTGKGFVDYLHIYRINRADYYMLNTDMSITEIAQEVGFCNVSYFDRIYKKHKGFSPKTYRKRGI